MSESPPALVDKFKTLLPSVRLINAYGAAEVAGLVCMGEVTSAHDISVGSALPGCTIYVLDDNQRPVRRGAVGEVYVGGAQLANGYVRDPGLTAERFIRDPFKSDGSLIYRTADSAESLADGRILY